MLRKIGNQDKNANVRLQELVNGVFLLEHENNPLSFLNVGSHIWVKRENDYEVYELTESWDKSGATLVDFVNNICREAGIEG